MRKSEGLSFWLVEKQGVKLNAIFQVLDRQGNKEGVCSVLEQSQVEMCRGSVPMSQAEGSKKISVPAGE